MKTWNISLTKNQKTPRKDHQYNDVTDIKVKQTRRSEEEEEEVVVEKHRQHISMSYQC